MTTTAKHIYDIKNNTTVILHFAIEEITNAHMLHIYVAESEHILKNMFDDRYYGFLNPGQSMRLKSESPELDIKDFLIAFKIKSVMNEYEDFKEYVLNVIAKPRPLSPN